MGPRNEFNGTAGNGGIKNPGFPKPDVSLWQGKEPDEGRGFSFPFQDTELELEPDQRFASQPQTPRTGCGTGGSGFEPGGSKGRSLVWNFTVPPGIHRKEEVPSSCTGWGVGNFFGCTKQLLEQQFLVRSLREGPSGGTLRREAGKTIPGWEGGLGTALGLLCPGEAPSDGSCEPREGWRTGAGWGFPQRECGRARAVTLISTD